MKKVLTLICAFALLLSLCSTALAEENVQTPAPEMAKPVQVSVVDELGAPVHGAAVRMTDAMNNVVDAWSTGDSDQLYFLKEGVYSAAEITLPEGYTADTEAAPFTVSLTEEEQGLYPGQVEYDHSHTEICSNPNHVGLELYTVDGNAAYCFNHGRDNPEDGVARYRMMAATPDLIWANAENKSDTITKEELYHSVRSVIYLSSMIQSQFNLPDEAVARYLTLMALKNFTDPKLFYSYDDEGNHLYDSATQSFLPGGTVLGAMVAHAKREKHPLPQNYIDAYKYLINPANYPTEQELASYQLYIYMPVQTGNNELEDDGYQWLLSVRRIEPQQVKLYVHSVTEFNATIKWNDANNKLHMRPSLSYVAARVRLLADGVAYVTHDMRIVDNGNNTYSVIVTGLPKLNGNGEEIVYTLKVGYFRFYSTNQTVVGNGETVVLSNMGAGFRPRPPFGPLTPIEVGPIIKPIIGPIDLP